MMVLIELREISCVVRSLGINTIWRQLGRQLALFHQRFVMGVINVACTGLELSILPDLGADRLPYLVTGAKGGKGRMELTKGGSQKPCISLHYRLLAVK